LNLVPMSAKDKMGVLKASRNTGDSLDSAAHSPVLVIGLGNPLRGDDSVGRIVAAGIKRRMHPFLKVVECSGEGTDLMELWADAGTVIVVDAVASGAETGMVHRFDASHLALPVRFKGGSTHAFGLGEAVELARALKQLPRRLIVFGVEGKRFDVGSKLSTEVKKIVPYVVDRVVQEARSLHGHIFE
jgi:hydrogenase maturation protease